MTPFAQAIGLSIGLALSTLTGCALTAPVAGKPEITRQDNMPLADNTLVTVGPRRLLELLANQMAAADPGMQPVDPLQFRDTAFPEGGWRLRELLEPDQRARIVQTLQVDYLILVSPLVYKVGDENGFFIPLVAGAQSAAHKSSVSATLYDLKSGAALCRIDSTATAQERVFSYVILFTGTTPHVVKPALDALVKTLVQTIQAAAPYHRTRMAILAAESPRETQ